MFWFAIHLENLELAQALLEKEFLLKQLVACALINKKGNLEIVNLLGEDNDSSSDSDEEDEDWNINNSGPRSSGESF